MWLLPDYIIKKLLLMDQKNWLRITEHLVELMKRLVMFTATVVATKQRSSGLSL
jgi:hypothetical protein